jgi:hypothetical protein
MIQLLEAQKLFGRHKEIPTRTNEFDFCSCGGSLQINEQDLNECIFCCSVYPVLAQREILLNEDEYTQFSQYRYSTCNHFKIVLEQFGGKQNYRIPLDVLDKIKEEFNLMTFPVDYFNVRKVLKKLKLTTLYNHVFLIMKILGANIAEFTNQEEETLILLFKSIQNPYLLFRGNRKNSLNYFYLLRQLCRQAGITRYQYLIPILKENTKVRESDEIYKKICEKLGWNFTPMG